MKLLIDLFFFLWLHNIKIRLEFISEDDYSIDRINYFVHREINRKKRIAHAMKTECCVRFGFLDSFLDEKNDLYSQCL